MPVPGRAPVPGLTGVAPGLTGVVPVKPRPLAGAPTTGALVAFGLVVPVKPAPDARPPIPLTVVALPPLGRVDGFPLGGVGVVFGPFGANESG